MYRGSAADLIKAGIVRADQFPSEGKSAITYSQGQVTTRRCKRDETYLRVMWERDGTVTAWVGLPAAVAAARKQAGNERRAAKVLEREMLEAMKDPGIVVMAKTLEESPARFKVGEACMLPGGSIAEITGEYQLRRVKCDDGAFLDSKGERISYLYGYRAKEPGGQEFFWPAHDLSNRDGSVRHLMLVSNPN